MAEFVAPLVVMGALVAIAALLGGLAVRLRRRGAGVMSPFEEMWHPAAHRSRIEVTEQVQRNAPPPDSGDPAARGDPPPDRPSTSPGRV